MTNKKFFGWLTVIGFIITISFIYKAFKLITHLQSEADEYFLHTPNHTEQTTVVIGAIIALFLTTLVGTKWFNTRNIIVVLIMAMASSLNAQGNLLGYTTKNDTFTVIGRKNMSESDQKLFQRAKVLIAFYKEQEKIEHKAGRPFKQLQENGLPVFWRDMPVYVLQRERKDKSSGKARRIVYDVHVVAYEMLTNETTYWGWVIIQ